MGLQVSKTDSSNTLMSSSDFDAIRDVSISIHCHLPMPIMYIMRFLAPANIAYRHLVEHPRTVLRRSDWCFRSPQCPLGTAVPQSMRHLNHQIASLREFLPSQTQEAATVTMSQAQTLPLALSQNSSKNKVAVETPS